MATETTSNSGKKSQAGKRPIKPIRRRDQLFKAVTALRAVWLELARAYLPPPEPALAASPRSG